MAVEIPFPVDRVAAAAARNLARISGVELASRRPNQPQVRLWLREHVHEFWIDRLEFAVNARGVGRMVGRVSQLLGHTYDAERDEEKILLGLTSSGCTPMRFRDCPGPEQLTLIATLGRRTFPVLATDASFAPGAASTERALAVAQLRRFHEGQARSPTGYASARAALLDTSRPIFWVWWLFPKLAAGADQGAGGGSRISDPDEAVRYLGDPVLAAQLSDVFRILRQRVEAPGAAPMPELMRSGYDLQQIIGCLTLFALYGPEAPTACTLVVDAEAILRVAEHQGSPRCGATERF